MLNGAEKGLGDLVAGVGPDIDDLVVTLLVGDDTGAILVVGLLHFGSGAGHFNLFLGGNDHVEDPDGDARAGRLAEAEGLQRVERLHSAFLTGNLITAPDDVGKLLLGDRVVEKAEFVRPDFIETDATGSRHEDLALTVSVDAAGGAEIRVPHADRIVHVDGFARHGELNLGRIREKGQVTLDLGVAQRDLAAIGEEVGTKRNVLRRRRDGLAARGSEDVVRREHEHARLQLRLHGKRHVHGHLVTVEVRVVGSTNEGVNPDRGPLDEDRLESLDRKTVQGGRTVEKDGVTLRHFFENVPDLGGLALDQLLGTPHGVHVAEFLEAANDEGLERRRRLLRLITRR